jgi:predicted aspartyl protease
MRWLLSLTLLLSLLSCADYSHTQVSGATLKKMEKLTLSADATQRILRGQDALRSYAEGPEVVSVPMEFNGRLPAVRVRINGGQPQQMIIDSGASLSVLEAEMAVKSGIRLLPSSALKLKAQGIAGSEEMRGGIAELQIGELKLKNMPVLVRTHQNQYRNLGGLVNESLGVNLLGLQNFARSCSWLRLDYRNRIVTIGLRGQSPAPTGPNAWSVPLGLHHGVASIVLSSGGHSWETVVDTGSSFGIEVQESVAQKLGVLEGSTPVTQDRLIGIGGFVDMKHKPVRTAVLPEINGFGNKVLQPQIAINTHGFNLCGSYFLSHYRVTFDFARRKLWLER